MCQCDRLKGSLTSKHRREARSRIYKGAPTFSRKAVQAIRRALPQASRSNGTRMYHYVSKCFRLCARPNAHWGVTPNQSFLLLDGEASFYGPCLYRLGVLAGWWGASIRCFFGDFYECRTTLSSAKQTPKDDHSCNCVMSYVQELYFYQ